MAEGFSVWSDSELEDFWGSVNRHGYRNADFEITQKPNPTSGAGVQAVTGTVTVRCKRSGVERTYRAGYGSTWPAEVDQDLARGVFGKRTA